MNTYYTFREARNEKELLQLLQLRYKGYRNSRLNGFCPENKHGVDLDKYDMYARHFGLFCVQDNFEMPIGYIRLVQKGISKMYDSIKNIAEMCTLDIEEVSAINPFPLMEYFPGAQQNIYLNSLIQNDNYTIGEAGRFIVNPSYRTLGLATFVIECMISSQMITRDFTHSIISCSSTHSSMYYKYGYKKIQNTKVEVIKKYDSPDDSLLLLLSVEDICESYRENLLKMAADFNKYHSINFCHQGQDHFSLVKSSESLLKQRKLIVAA